ncbi:AraC family ligand binding domain-containing protein [Parabacteroides sp. OttesenSCG-928-N08]|nr:AraC family ligand binding domain-containing protein [Parabacteroides sp. OttesenSCG-928-N08]
MNRHKDNLRYLTISPRDEEWGIVVTTVGYQFIPPGSKYPLSRHPDSYEFKPQNGRTLNEYQLVYITKGGGYFSSTSVKKQRIQAGTMILLFPGEWHSYYPDEESGWDEYWVGFRGMHIDKRVENSFFTKNEPLYAIGLSATIVTLYEDILKQASQEKSGYQQMISSIVLHILGRGVSIDSIGIDTWGGGLWLCRRRRVTVGAAPLLPRPLYGGCAGAVLSTDLPRRALPEERHTDYELQQYLSIVSRA